MQDGVEAGGLAAAAAVVGRRSDRGEPSEGPEPTGGQAPQSYSRCGDGRVVEAAVEFVDPFKQ